MIFINVENTVDSQRNLLLREIFSSFSYYSGCVSSKWVAPSC